MNRKIIQISTEGEHDVIYALCDDGTLWKGVQKYVEDEPFKARTTPYGSKINDGHPAKYHYEFSWEQVPGVPSDTSNLTRAR